MALYPMLAWTRTRYERTAAAIRAALNDDIARARGMSRLARDTGLTREGLLPGTVGERQSRACDGAEDHQGAGYEAACRYVGCTQADGAWRAKKKRSADRAPWPEAEDESKR